MEESYNKVDELTTPKGEETTTNAMASGIRNENYRILKIFADLFSGLFLPLLVPTYAYVFAILTTYLSAVSENSKIISSVVVFILTAIIPLTVILLLMRKGKVSDVSIDNRKERTIPYLTTILCYFITALYLWLTPRWLPMFFAGAGISAIIATLITLRYKISAHTTSMGGLCAMIVYIGLHHLATVQILPWLAATILASGAVGSARIFLGRHTPSQVYSGWLLGFAVTIIFMNI